MSVMDGGGKMYCNGGANLCHDEGWWGIISSHNSFHKASVQRLYKGTNKSHFLACVFKYNSGVIAFTAQTIGRHYHCQVVDIHLSSRRIFSSGKYLVEEVKIIVLYLTVLHYMQK